MTLILDSSVCREILNPEIYLNFVMASDCVVHCEVVNEDKLFNVELTKVKLLLLSVVMIRTCVPSPTKIQGELSVCFPTVRLTFMVLCPLLSSFFVSLPILMVEELARDFNSRLV